MFVRGMCFFHVLVFSKSMSSKYFHVRSNLSLNGFEHLSGKALHVEGNKVPKVLGFHRSVFFGSINL